MNKSLKYILFFGLIVIILYFADITTIMKEAFDMTECIESSKDGAPGCQYRSSHKKEWGDCKKKQQKKYDKYVSKVAYDKCLQKMMNDSLVTTMSTDEEGENKNIDVNHPATLNWAVGETEEYLKDKREGDKVIKPILSFGDGRKFLTSGAIGGSILDRIQGVKTSGTTFDNMYSYLMGEGEDEDDEYY